jgi:hypothetical protein
MKTLEKLNISHEICIFTVKMDILVIQFLNLDPLGVFERYTTDVRIAPDSQLKNRLAEIRYEDLQAM